MSINVQYSVSALINEIYRHAVTRVIFVKEITSSWTWSRGGLLSQISQFVLVACVENLTESRLPLREFTVAVLFIIHLNIPAIPTDRSIRFISARYVAYVGRQRRRPIQW